MAQHTFTRRRFLGTTAAAVADPAPCATVTERDPTHIDFTLKPALDVQANMRFPEFKAV